MALFDGLSGTTKRKQVLDATGLDRTRLRALLRPEGIDPAAVANLLAAMRRASKPVPPKALGPIGREPLLHDFEWAGIDPETFRYRCQLGTMPDGQPWIVEAAFGAYEDPDGSRLLLTGVNWSPGVLTPFRSLMYHGSLDGLLAGQWIEGDSPVVVAAHAIVPGASYTDRGKTALSLPWQADRALGETVTAVTKAWAAQQAREHRHAMARLRRREALTERKPERLSKKDAAYRVMRQAYMKASKNNTLPATARQVFYAARPLILELLADGETISDHYFTQTLLPDYEREHPEETADWDVVYDARGHLIEPHTRRKVDLGTLSVRQYLGDRREFTSAAVKAGAFAWPTSGPRHRFRAALFVEKEGFDPLFRATGFAERHDIAIMSTKGMSVVALRLLVDRWAEDGHDIKVLVAHDFDVSGFSIFGTLARDTRRYTYVNTVQIVDIGLRLADVKKWELQDEPVVHKGEWAKRAATLRRHGATEEEIAFLRTKRVELNAFTSDQLIDWLEGKLAEHGVVKVVPDAATLAAAYRAAAEHEHVAKGLPELRAEAQRASAERAPPDDLAERVRRELEANPGLSWDDVVDGIARAAL